jgi:uncharacterized GH25 family protein
MGIPMTSHQRLNRRLTGWLLGLFFAATVPVAAHDFWIQPSAFLTKPGMLVGLQLLVGQDMIGDPVPRDPAAVKAFVVVSGSDQKEVPGRDGGNPAGIVRVSTPGLLVVGYQSYPRSIALTPDKFSQYLGEEGLDEIRSLALASKKFDRPARELYSRCAKSLLLSGNTSATDHDRRLGLTFEIVAERNPYLASAGRPLAFALTYDGKPMPRALVIAVNERNPAMKLSARSDNAGRVVFTFPAGGAWLVKAVHMIPSKSPDADWESFWASLTFELPNAKEVSR